MDGRGCQYFRCWVYVECIFVMSWILGLVYSEWWACFGEVLSVLILVSFSCWCGLIGLDFGLRVCRVEI